MNNKNISENEYNKIEFLKEDYLNVEIPEELSRIVSRTIELSEIKKETYNGTKDKNSQSGGSVSMSKKVIKMRTRRFVTSAAALLLVISGFSIGVNESPAFAHSMSKIPVLSSLAKVVTVSEIHENSNNIKVTANIPKVEGLSDKAFADKVNKQIQEKINEKVARTKADFNKNSSSSNSKDTVKKEIYINYEVYGIHNGILSFCVYKTSTSGSAYFDEDFYNIDVNKNKEITLKDVLGPEYMSIADKSIKSQIEERSKMPENSYFTGNDGFTGIRKNQAFYINNHGNPVAVFNKYEIAPGSMGIQEFEITK